MSLGVDEKIDYREKLEMQDARFSMFTEFRAYWSEAVYSQKVCQGNTQRDKQVATLEETLLRKLYHRSNFVRSRVCEGDCKTVEELGSFVNGNFIPWSPIGKTTPWDGWTETFPP